MESTPLSDATKYCPRGLRQNRPARRAHAGIHHHHVHRLLREIAIRLRHHEGAFGDLERRPLVADVHDLRRRADAQNHAFHRAHKVVGEAEIGGQRECERQRKRIVRMKKVQHFYFDHNATTPVSPEVLETMVSCLGKCTVTRPASIISGRSPSSGWKARAARRPR